MNARAVPNVGEHRDYVAAAICVIVVVLAGFSIDAPLLSHLGSVSLLVRAHGLIMLTWIMLFFAQALLVARHRVDLHMHLGIFGAALAVAVVVADTATLITACRLGGNHMPHMPAPLFLALGLFNLSTFAILVGAAIVLRKRRSDWHKRLMLLATCSIILPVIGRLPMGPLADFLVFYACVLIPAIVDSMRHRRVHPAFGWGAPLLIASQHLAFLGATTQAWGHFVTRLFA